eukprot:5620946-Pyramimonas_sp.AAC.1
MMPTCRITSPVSPCASVPCTCFGPHAPQAMLKNTWDDYRFEHRCQSEDPKKQRTPLVGELGKRFPEMKDGAALFGTL